MKRSVCLLILLGVFSLALATDEIPAPLPVAGSGAKISTGAILEQVVARLKRAEQIIYPELNRTQSADVTVLLQEAYALLELIPQDTELSVRKTEGGPDVEAMLDPNRGGQPVSRLIERPRPVPERYPIMTEEFNTLLQTITAEPYRRNKLLLLTTATESYRYSVDQIIRLLDSLSFTYDRLQALETIYPGCTDPQNKYRILDSFSLMADKTRAAELMRD